MSYSPRAAAIEHYHQGTFRDVPEIPDHEPGSPKAVQFLEDIRGRRFASLAYAIRSLLDHTFEHGVQPRESDLSDLHELSGWRSVHSDVLSTIQDSIQAITDTEAYQIGQRYTDIVESCNPDMGHALRLNSQLFPGANTATLTMATNLESLHHIISYHDKDGLYEGRHAALARNSMVLPSQLALISVNQMMAARKALTDPATGKAWGHAGSLLDPERFVLKPTRDGGAAVNYANFWGMRVPSGFTPMEERVAPLENSAAIRDIQSEHASTLGCPVTFLPGYMRRLFNLYIDQAEARQLLQ